MKHILLIFILIILFAICSKTFIEKFNIFNYNIKNDEYYNALNFKFITDYRINSLPSNNLKFEIKNKNFEYNDSNYIQNLYKIFEINDNLNILYNVAENIKWSSWKKPDDNIIIIYDKFIKYLNLILKENNINNIYNIFKNYRINLNNKKNILLNIDILLYRENKIHAKHVNIIVYYNNNKYYILYLNIIGYVDQYNIINNSFLKDINIENHVNNDKKSTNCKNTDNDKILELLINKISPENYTDNDIKNIKKNKIYNKNQQIVKKHFMNNLYNPVTIYPSNT